MSKLLLNLTQKFFGPDTVPGSAGTGGVDTSDTEGVIDYFALDDKPEAEVIPLAERKPAREIPDSKDKGTTDKDEEDEETDTTGKEKGEEEDEDELKALEEDLEGPTEEQLELVTPVRRKEILKKYPELFKDFPYLEKAYYREQQFTEIFPTIDEAKEAVAKGEILDRFENDIMSGNIVTVLKATQNDNPDAFLNIVDNYLGALAQVDERAYHHVIGNTIKHTVAGMVTEGKKSNNEALITAAQILHQWTFGNSDFKPPTTLGKPKTEQENQQVNEVRRREQELNQRQLGDAVNSMNTRVNNSLIATIEANIDPKGSMTDYVKRTAVKEASETLERLFSQDKRFISITDRLWENAIRGGYKSTDLDKIRSAYVAKAKVLLPTVIKQARQNALRGMGKQVKDSDTTSSESTSRRGPIAPGRPRSTSNSGKMTKAADIPQGMSTLEFLNSD